MDSLSGNRQGFGEVGGVRLAELVEKVGAWELLGGSEDQLMSRMMQISGVVAKGFADEDRSGIVASSEHLRGR